jgi:aspartyl-tRNA(Asn)/glutamyl-tRNA(Gln) amidotransferase subunit A
LKKSEFGRDLLESIYATYIVISCAEATSNDANLDGIKFGPYYGGKTYQEVMYNARTKGFSELIKRRFVIGSFALMRENQDVLFLRAQRTGPRSSKDNAILKDHDFIYVPAAPSIAPSFSAASDKLSDEYLIADNHLGLGNFAGLPSITLPLTLEEGMPIGINFMGRAFEEAKLYQIAAAFESISGLSRTYPSVTKRRAIYELRSRHWSRDPRRDADQVQDVLRRPRWDSRMNRILKSPRSIWPIPARCPS